MSVAVVGGRSGAASRRHGMIGEMFEAALWGRAFRPFFLLAGLWGCVAPIAWIAMLSGQVPAPAWLSPFAWHAHEMLFGLVVAAIGGFLLTSVPVWTGRTPVTGSRLAGLAALWLAGRVAMLAAAALPSSIVAACDLAFPVALAATLARPLLTASQRRNWGIWAIVLALGGADAMMHAEALGLARGAVSVALRFAIWLVVALIVVVGGRITPAFTRNALVRAGVQAPVRARAWLDRSAIALVALLPLIELVCPRTTWSGAVELAAALAVGARMLGWQSLRTGRDPLLWSLHAGYAWVAIGLLLVALSDLTQALAFNLGMHALTAGAMGSMILAVMTRVGLGHTGRPLVLPRGASLAYALVHAGALARLVATFLPDVYLPALTLAAILWSAAFGLFSALYAPILMRPRVDGQPG